MIRESRKYALRGTIVDDTSRPIEGMRVALSLTGNGSHGEAVVLPSPERCDNGRSPEISKPDLATLTTDELGRFCIRLSLGNDGATEGPHIENGPRTYIAHLATSASREWDTARLELPFDVAPSSVLLRFDPEPTTVYVDAETTAIEAVLYVEEDGQTRSLPGIALTLTNESGQVLGSRRETNGSGRVRFEFPSPTLGQPGRGELRVTFEGTQEYGRSSHRAPIERHTHVLLAPADPNQTVLPAASPEDGFDVRIFANAHGERALGIVEARIGDSLIGAADVENGSANLTLAFSPAEATRVPITFRFSPSAPWFEAAEDLTLELPVRGPNPWRQVLMMATGALVIVYFGMGRLARAPSSKRNGPPKLLPRGEAVVEVIAPRDEKSGWIGRVVDAHDGHALEGAVVRVERAGFGTTTVLVRTLADKTGRFAIEAYERKEEDSLVCESTFHGAVRHALPKSGELLIQLVTRKRTLLARLVEWARRRGKPFDSSPEPTPGHVIQAAGPEVAIARWAGAVEQAAFGIDPIDARAEDDVNRLFPSRTANEGTSEATPEAATPASTVEKSAKQ